MIKEELNFLLDRKISKNLDDALNVAADEEKHILKMKQAYISKHNSNRKNKLFYWWFTNEKNDVT